MSAACLNTSARTELATWIAELSRSRFHVPAWVAHECYGKITSDLSPLKPMEKAASDLLSAAGALQIEARRFIDDKRAREFDDRDGGRKDRLGFLASMDQEIARLAARGHFMRTSSKSVLEDASDFLVKLVNAHVLDSDIYAGLPTVEAEHAVRLMGQHPPGFLDRKKEQNRYGDLIIWQEIVRHAREKSIKSVVLCTNDNKQDWVYVPPTIIDENGRQLSNEARQSFKVILPLPLLMHEIRIHNPSAKLTIVNLGMLATMLHREMARSCPSFFAAYQPVAQAALPAEPSAPPPAGEPPVEPVEVQPVESAAKFSLRDALRDIRSKNSELGSVAIQSIRDALPEGFTKEDLGNLARALVEAAADGLEAAALLARDLAIRQPTVTTEVRMQLVGSMLLAAYFEEGRIRDKPLEGVLPVLFSVQSDPDLRPVVDALDAALSNHKPHYLLTPDVTAPTASLTITGKTESGATRLTGVLNGEHPLLEDVQSGSSRSLVRVFAGATSATADEFRTVLAKYFRVSVSQVDLNLVRSQRLAWDDLVGFVEWGARSHTVLR